MKDSFKSQLFTKDMLILCLFENKIQGFAFHDYINKQHPNIKFTSEEQENSALPFLDILIDNSGDKIKTSVNHKPTYTGLLTNFNSFIPFTYKSGLIRTLVDRCFRIASDWKRFDFDLKNLVKTLGRNAFCLLYTSPSPRDS